MADKQFPDPEASLAEQLRSLLFPKGHVEGFMPEQAAVSVDSGLACLMGRGYQERLGALIDRVEELEKR